MRSVILLVTCVRAIVSHRPPGAIAGGPLYPQRGYDVPGSERGLGSSSESTQSADTPDADGPAYNPAPRRQPAGLNRSISQSKLRANQGNFRSMLTHEFDDVSKELGTKLTGQIENVQGGYDKLRFKQVFVIRKHIVSDGVRKVVTIDVKENVVPRGAPEDADRTDIGAYAFLGCILFLLAGLVFTATIKVYKRRILTRHLRSGAGKSFAV